MKRDQGVIKKRKRLWDAFGWGYRNQSNRLLKNHSLNCGCSMCRARTYFKRKERRDKRHQDKINIKNEE